MALLPAVTSISLREAHFEALAQLPRPLPLVEVVADNFLNRRGPHYARLQALTADTPVALHALGLSIGTAPDGHYLDQLAALAEDLGALCLSDHLSLSQGGDGPVPDLLPLGYDEHTLAVVVEHVKQVQDRLPVPLLLENVSRYLAYTSDTLDEGAFFTTLVAETGIGLLLDINNLHVTAHNLERDPVADLLSYPLNAVAQYHLAGHKAEGSLLLDHHGCEVDESVWRLYRQALEHTGPVATIIEWDNDLPSLDTLLDEAERARHAMCWRALA